MVSLDVPETTENALQPTPEAQLATAESAEVVNNATEEVTLASEADAEPTPEDVLAVAHITADELVEEDTLPEVPEATTAPTPKVKAEPVVVEEVVAEAVPEAPAAPTEEQELAKAQRQGLLQAVFAQLDLQEEEYLATIDKAALQELVVLMEALNERPLAVEILRKVGPLKKRYDTAYAAALDTLKDQPESEQLSAQRDAYANLSRRFTEALRKFNKSREVFDEQQKKLKEENSARKHTLLNALRAIVSAENVQAMKEVRAIQEEWRNIGPVLPQDVEQLKLSFKSLLDQFYAMRKPLMELEDQARKVNQDIKEKILAELEKIVAAKPEEGLEKYFEETTNRVKQLQEQWKNTGPVPREATESLWEKFRGLTDEYYHHRKGVVATQRESRNQMVSTAEEMLNQARALTDFVADHLDHWREKSNEVKALNEAWYKVRPALFRSNKEWLDEFKTHIDGFFNRRAEFFAELDKGRDDILKQKEALVAEAEKLQDSEAWRETADRFKQLQRLWNELGPDNHKEGIRVLRRFRKVSDHFFKRFKEHLGNLGKAEEGNLELKLKVIEELEGLQVRPAEPGEPSTEEQARELKARWDGIGHVPLAKKDEVYSRYFKALDAVLGRQNYAGGGGQGGQGGGGFGGERRGPRPEGAGGAPRREGGGGFGGGERREGGGSFGGGQRREGGGGFGGGMRFDGPPQRGGRKGGNDRNAPREEKQVFVPLTPAQEEEARLKKQIAAISEEILQIETNLSFFAKSKGANALTGQYTTQLETLNANKASIEAEIKNVRRKAHEAQREAEAAAKAAQEAAEKAAQEAAEKSASDAESAVTEPIAVDVEAATEAVAMMTPEAVAESATEQVTEAIALDVADEPDTTE